MLASNDETIQSTLSDLLIQLGYKSFESQIAFLRLLILSKVTDEKTIQAMRADDANEDKQAWLKCHREGYQTYRSTVPFFMPLHVKEDIEGYLAKDETFKPLLSIPLEAPAEAMAWLVHATQLFCLRSSFHAEGPKNDTLIRWSEKSRACNTGENIKALVWEEKVLRPLGLIGGNSWPAISVETPTALLLHGGLEATVKRRIGYLAHCMQYQQQDKLIRLPVLYPSNPRGLFLNEPSTVQLLADWFLTAYGEVRLGMYEAICTKIQAVFNDDNYKKTQWFDSASLDRLKARLLTVLDLPADGWPKGGYVRQVSKRAALKSQWQAFERAGHSHLVDWPSAFDMVAVHLAALTQRYPALINCFELIHLPLYVESATSIHTLANTEDSLLMVYHWCQRRGIQQVITVSDNEGHQHRYQQAQTEALLEGWGLPTATVSPSAMNWQLATALDNVAKTLYVQGVYGPWAQADALKELIEQHRETRHHVYDSEKGEVLSWPSFIERCEGLPYAPPINALSKDSPYYPFPCPHNQPALGGMLQGYWQAYDDERERQIWLSSWYGEDVSDYLLLGYQGGANYPLPSLTNPNLCLHEVSEREQVLLRLAKCLKRPVWYWGDTEPLYVYGREEEGEPYLVSYSLQNNQWMHYLTYRAIPSVIGIAPYQQTTLLIPDSPKDKKENIISDYLFSTLDELEKILKETEAIKNNEDKIKSYGRLIRFANQREVQDRALGGETDKRNRYLQIQGMLGLGECYEVYRELTPQNARQCVWALGLYQTALAIVEKSLAEAKTSAFSKEATAFKLTEAENSNWQSLELILYEKIITALNSLSSENSLTSSSYIKQSKTHKAVLNTLRCEVKDQLKVIEKCYGFPIPHPSQEDISQGWQHYSKGDPSYVDSINDVYQSINTCLITFTADLWEKALVLTGAVPCESCLLGLGSLVRQEATPYSDIECVLLIEKDTPANRLYFRKAVVIFHGLTLSLGETIIPSLSIPALHGGSDENLSDFYDRGYYIKRGYSLDGLMGHASKVPLGRLSLPKMPWGLELIQTPAALAYHVTPVSDRLEGHHLAAMLANTVFVSGNKDLQVEFNKTVQAHLTYKSKQISVSTTVQEKRALDELREDIETYNPEISGNDEGKQLHVKKDLYRLPTLLIQGLTQLLGGREQRAHQELTYLFQQELFDERAQQIIAVWLILAKTARLQMYIRNESQHDNLAFTREQEKGIKKQKLLSGIEKKLEVNLIPTGLIFCWYQIALPVYSHIKKYFFPTNLKNLNRLSYQVGKEVNSFSLFLKNDDCFLYNEKSCIQISRRLQQLATAKAWVEHWLMMLDKSFVINNQELREDQGINEKKITAYCQAYKEQSYLAIISRDKDEKYTALNEIKKTLKWVKKLGLIEEEIALLENQFLLRVNLGSYDKVYQMLNKLLNLQENYYGKGHIKIVNTLINLGAFYLSKSDYKKSYFYYKKALELQESYYGIGHIETARTLNHLGKALYSKGCIQEAESYYKRALKLQESYYGINHIKTAETLNYLGDIDNSVDINDNGRSYYERALGIKESYYGAGHIETCVILANLGEVCYSIGFYEEARSYCERVLKLKEGYYGIFHIQTVSTLRQLGKICYLSGSYEEARSYYERVLHFEESYYDVDDINLAATLSKLGDLCCSKDCYEEALCYYERALKIKQNHYNEDQCGKGDYSRSHIEIIEILVNLGDVYDLLNCHEEAYPYYEQALNLFESHFGTAPKHLIALGHIFASSNSSYKEARVFYKCMLKFQEGSDDVDHTEILETLNLLANICLPLGRYTEACSYYKNILKLEKRYYGMEHIKTVETLKSLANVYLSRNRHEEACAYYERALKLEEDYYGINHIDIVQTLKSLANVWQSADRYEEARPYYERALKIEQSYYSTDYIETTKTLKNLARVYLPTGCYQEARSYYKDALKVQNEHHSIEDIEVAKTLIGLGFVYGLEDRHEEMYSYLERILDLFESKCGVEHIKMAKILSNIGSISDSSGRYKEARFFYQIVLKIQEGYYGVEHIETAKTLENLGHVYQSEGCYEKARFYYTQGLNLQESYYGIYNIETARIVENLGNICNAEGHYEEARSYFERLLALFERHYGVGHIKTLKAWTNLGSMCRSAGCYDEARIYYECVLEIQQEHPSVEYTAIVETLDKLGGICWSAGYYEDARIYCEQALNFQETYYGLGHIKTGWILSNLGAIYASMGDYKEARLHYGRKLELQERHYGINHMKIVATLENLGAACNADNCYEEAYIYYKRALEILDKHSDVDYIRTAKILAQLGSICELTDCCDERYMYFDRILGLFTDDDGDMHPELRECSTLLSEMKKQLVSTNLNKEDIVESKHSLELQKSEKSLKEKEELTFSTNKQSFFASDKEKPNTNVLKRAQRALEEGNQYASQENYKEAKRSYERGLICLENTSSSSDSLTNLIAQLQQGLEEAQKHLAESQEKMLQP